MSPGDDLINSPAVEGGRGPKPKLKRPRILNKPRPARAARLPTGDWGECCVDVYELMNHIGEGTYGLVNFNYF